MNNKIQRASILVENHEDIISDLKESASRCEAQVDMNTEAIDTINQRMARYDSNNEVSELRFKAIEDELQIKAYQMSFEDKKKMKDLEDRIKKLENEMNVRCAGKHFCGAKN